MSEILRQLEEEISTDTLQQEIIDEVELLKILLSSKYRDTIKKSFLSEENTEIHLTVSKKAIQLIQSSTLSFTSCPCKPIRHRGGCVHEVDSTGKAIDCG